MRRMSQGLDLLCHQTYSRLVNIKRDCYLKNCIFQTVEESFEVEKILKKKESKKGNILYLVQWKNFEDPRDHTWEPSENIKAAQGLIDKFERDLDVNMS